MTDAQLKENRKRTLKTLSKLMHDAYSGLACDEYDMIKSTYLYIKMRQTLYNMEKGGAE